MFAGGGAKIIVTPLSQFKQMHKTLPAFTIQHYVANKYTY